MIATAYGSAERKSRVEALPWPLAFFEEGMMSDKTSSEKNNAQFEFCEECAGTGVTSACNPLKEHPCPYCQEEITKSVVVPGSHPLAELLARKLSGIESVPLEPQRRMIRVAITAAVKWHENHKRADKEES